MKKKLSLLLSLVSCIIIPGVFVKSANAQVTPDGTTNTTVNAEGNDFTIQNGDRAGNNLFHSFQDFSVQTVAQACQSDRLAGKISNFTLEGRGGIPPQPIEPIDLDTILVNGKTTTPQPPVQSQVQSLDIKPIKTSIGDILPAKGVIKTEDGQIILTAYSTDKIPTRTPDVSPNCISNVN